MVNDAEDFIKKVYPRVGGGTELDYGTEDIEEGLSPRGRGNRL